MADKVKDDSGDVTVKKHRSPNYPALSLQKSVERAAQLHSKYKRSLVPIHLAHELWEYTPHGGAGNQAVAALRYYGLIDVEGEGKERKIRLSETGYRIVANSPDRTALLKESAVAPAIHKELWEKYRADEHFPSSEIIRHYLRWDREAGKFNEETVGGFIDNFFGSLRYAELLKGDVKIGQDGDPYVGDDPLPRSPVCKLPAIGDFVQWAHQPGVYKYPQPQKVLGVDGSWVFIEDDPTPRPIDQVFVMKASSSPVQGNQMPPPNPFVNKKEGEWGVPTLSFPLPRGNMIEIRLKSKVTADEFKKIKAILDLSEDSFLEEDAE